MPADATRQAEIEAIVARLRDEVQRSLPTSPAVGALEDPLPSRRELDRLWHVTAERPYFHRPGTWGRARGALVMPLKAVLRRMMRWYVEPVAADQRAFNAALLRTLDELTVWVRAELERIERERPAPDETAVP